MPGPVVPSSPGEIARVLPAPEVDDLLSRQAGQLDPEVVAVHDVGKVAPPRATLEAVEGAEHGVLLVGDDEPPLIPEATPRQGDQE